MTSPAPTVTCAYCLRTGLAADASAPSHPARHGWTSKGGSGGANGQLGSRHSVACRGCTFQHFGLSCEGTKAAIRDAEAWLGNVDGRLSALASLPPLEYGRRDYNRKGHPIVARIEVRPGQVSPLSGPGWHPEYQTLLDARRRELEAEREQAADLLPRLRAALASWKPSA